MKIVIISEWEARGDRLSTVWFCSRGAYTTNLCIAGADNDTSSGSSSSKATKYQEIVGARRVGLISIHLQHPPDEVRTITMIHSPASPPMKKQ